MTGPDVSDLYRNLSTPSLLDLQAAFRIDLARGGDPTFINGRLELIARELQARGPDEHTEPRRPLIADRPRA